MIRQRLPIPRLSVPQDIFCGSGSLAALRAIPATRTLILSGKSLSHELLESVRRNSTALEIEHLIRPPHEPALEDISILLEKLGSFSPDCIVAVGGGSVLDTAKLLMVRIEAPGFDLGTSSRYFSLPPLKSKISMVAIPTTPGSGSEASSSAVFINSNGFKVPVTSPDFLFDVVAYDPRFMKAIPASVVGSAIVDSITHAVESYFSVVNNPFAVHMAEKALALIAEHALPYFENPSDDNKILQLQLAALYAGIAQNLNGVGACHSLAHQLHKFNIPHGVANGIFLPKVLSVYCADTKINASLERLTRTIQMPSVEDLLRSIQIRAEIPSNLVGLRNKVDLNAMATAALEDICTRFSPCKLTHETFVRLIEESLQ